MLLASHTLCIAYSSSVSESLCPFPCRFLATTTNPRAVFDVTVPYQQSRIQGAIAYPGYKLLAACLRAGLSHMCSVIFHNPSGYALGITQYYFVHMCERALVGMLLL